MDNIVEMYVYEKKKIEQMHTVNGKLSSKGIWELVRLADKYGRTKEQYFPDDYGTDDYWRNR